MKNIGFIYFEETHHIHHFIGIASELYKMNEFNISIITYKGKHEYLRYLIDLLELPQEIIIELPTKKHRVITEFITQRRMPSSKYLFIKNKGFLLSFDALVFSDINQGYLFDRRVNKKTMFVYTRHGLTSRSYPFNSIETTKFDLIYSHGQKCLDYHFKYFDYPNTEFKIIGYQKLDIVKLEDQNSEKFFNNEKPIILYNPHFQPEYSSWYKLGVEVLEYFYNNEDYNLIFAPHINLFNKKGFANIKSIPEKYFSKENIVIDLGSTNSINMKYTLNSDLYLGDLSSQVYEFLLYPKPCIFINANNVDWKDDMVYNNWKLGKVIDNTKDLNKLIESRKEWENDYTKLQIAELGYSNDISINEPSKLAAITLKNKLNTWNQKQ